MTDRKLTPEEQEAVEQMAKTILSFGLHSGLDFAEEIGISTARKVAKELLNLRGKCKACNGTRWRNNNEEPFVIKTICPDCNGTGKGEKLLLVRADDQTPPMYPVFCCDHCEKNMKQAQQNMIKENWVKVVEV